MIVPQRERAEGGPATWEPPAQPPARLVEETRPTLAGAPLKNGPSVDSPDRRWYA